MEEDKRKYLLSRIKREEALINSDFQRFKKIYQGKQITEDKKQVYMDHISHTMELNNTLANNLFEYLEKNQVEGVFSRVNCIFTDLLDKYRLLQNKLLFFEKGQVRKEIHQICDICQEKIESCKIEKIRQGLDEESQCRSAMIKKILEQAELQRNKPLFTEDEDRIFKKELQRVFQSKQLVLQTHINESSVFLTTVEEQIAEFMVSFRREFSDWGQQHPQEKQNESWGRMMKSYINKKLTNAFNTKIPSWIKKMHDMFTDRQPSKPKIYYMNKQCQVSNQTESQIVCQQQINDLNHQLILKRQALRQKQQELELQKIKYTSIKAQLDSTQSYYVDKIFQANQGRSKQKMNSKIMDVKSSNSLRKSTNINQFEQISESQVSQANQKLASQRRKKKAVIVPSQLKKKTKNTMITEDGSIVISRDPSIFSEQHNQKENIGENGSTLIQKEDMNFRGQNGNSIGQPLRLKKKVYNRQKRQQLIQNSTNQGLQGLQSIQSQQFSNKMEPIKHLSVSQLKEQVRTIVTQLQNDEKARSKIINNRRQSSITMTEDILSVSIVNKNKSIKRSNHQSIPSKAKSTYNQIQQSYNSPLKDHPQLDQLLNKIILISNSEIDPNEINKQHLQEVINNFLHKLQKKSSNSTYQVPIKISKLLLLGEQKSNDQKLIRQSQYVGLGKSLKKKKQVQNSIRKNNSLQVCSMQFPCISIKNYSIQQAGSLHHFSKNHMPLFIDQNYAQYFENSFTKAHERQIIKPTSSQLQQIQNIFSELQALKRKDNKIFISYCTFLRYPYTSQKERSVIGMINSLTFSVFCNIFLKILWIHRNCTIQSSGPFCNHIMRFKQNLSSQRLQKTDRKLKK